MTEETPEPDVEETEESPPATDRRLWEQMQDAIQAVLVEDDATEENDDPNATWIVSNYWLTAECVSVSGEKFITHIHPAEEGWWSHMGLLEAAREAIKRYRANLYDTFDEDEDDDDASHAG